DLADTSIRFKPNGGIDVYTPCSEPASNFPIAPGGTTISLTDDDSELLPLPFTFDFYGTGYTSVYVGSNGYLTFGAPDTAYTESIEGHFEFPRIAPLFDDLNPSAGGTVNARTVGDSVAITWSDVPEYSTSNSNSFQVVLEASGEFTVTWLGIAATDAVVGISAGAGVDVDFEVNDLSASQAGCQPQPPSVQDITVATNPGTPVEIQLLASDDGEPEPLSITIESLPSGTLTDLGSGASITTAPYTLVDAEDARVRFTPAPGQYLTEFTYSADDGGTPPEGGLSNLGTVEIDVSTQPEVVISWDMDENPGWFLGGSWNWGQPTGQSGDPTSGATGSNVIGYNLNGAYQNNLGEIWANTPTFDCSESTNTTLHFKRWLGVDRSSNDNASISISPNAGFTWFVIYENDDVLLQDTAWQDIELDISEYADGVSSVRLRWTMGSTNGSGTYGGWNLDDVEIRGIPASKAIPGDLNLDGAVDGQDLTLLLAGWGACDGCIEDITADGLVNGADLTILLSNWGI
ncbi:MAG: hypothetical protein VX641_05105, partial [Planctomycetota bacterium]|nr:hypothetical protein [Planctomycetota bacterium]